MKHSLFILISDLLAIFVLSLGLSGCGARQQVSPTDPDGRVVKDDLGREVRLPIKVGRAVSLAPNLTEMVFAIGAGDRLVGVTTYCNYPEEAKAIQKVGDTLNPNMESIIALKPDVVLVSTASQIENFTKTLDQNGIAVFVTNPNSIDSVNSNLLKLGSVFDKTEAVQTLVESLRKRSATAAVADKNRDRLRVLVQLETETIFTVGKSSFITDIIDKAGGKSVTDNVDSPYFPLSKETAVALKPDVIILSDSENNRRPNDVFKDSPAVKNGHILRVNADILSRPGPRLVDALEQISNYLNEVAPK